MWVAQMTIQPAGDGLVTGGSRPGHDVRPIEGIRLCGPTAVVERCVPACEGEEGTGVGDVPAGDIAFEDYFRARRDTLRRTAYLMCGDWHRADDHTQAAFVALHRHWRRIRDKGALDAWMRKTLVRTVVDESRRPWRRGRSTEDPAGTTAGARPAGGGGPPPA